MEVNSVQTKIWASIAKTCLNQSGEVEQQMLLEIVHLITSLVEEWISRILWRLNKSNQSKQVTKILLLQMQQVKQ